MEELSKKCMSACRETYEQIDKPISNRHWRRIKRKLLAYSESGQKITDVRDAARLRKLNPRAKIDLDTVRRYQAYADAFPNFSCTGEELLAGIKKVLHPAPSLKTVYRWGQSIECPFSLTRSYEPDEVRLWIQKIISQSNFPIKPKPPNLRY